jgi:hypothetical protein
MGFAVRMVRAGVGGLLLLVAAPLMVAGGALHLVGDRRAADGTFAASIEHLRVDGRAIVVTDVDALLRSGAPFARGGQTTLSISGCGPGGPLFFGLAPFADVERYLAGVAQTRVTRVRLAVGPLPVDATAVPGERELDEPPAAQPFWLGTSSGLIRDGRVEAALSWSPAAVRGRHLALVVMNADGSPRVDVGLRAQLRPAWLGPTAAGLLILGGAVALLALVVLAWSPARRRPAPALAAETPLTAVVPPLPPLPPVTLRFLWPPVPVPDEKRVAPISPN